MVDALKKPKGRASSGIPPAKTKARKSAVKAAKAGRKSAKKPVRKAAGARGRHHYSVYVIELSRNVIVQEPRFRKANPDFDITKPCVYVGMTGLSPDARFDKHKAGIQSNRFAREYGLHLLPALYEMYNPMPYDGARDMEVELAIALREQGYGVWQA
jgi:hypothetical protein